MGVDLKRRIRGTVLTVAGLTAPAAALTARADLMIFYNGDFKYGQTQKTDGGWTLAVDGKTETYKDSQVKLVVPGIEEPAPGEVVTATDFRHEATEAIADHKIWNITAARANRFVLRGEEDREVLMDVEEKFAIPRIHIHPAHYSFYKQRGSYMTAAIVNETTETLRGVEFRVFFYGAEEQLLTSKDFYVHRLPGTPEGGRPIPRRFGLEIPDLPFEAIHRLRVVRKF